MIGGRTELRVGRTPEGPGGSGPSTSPNATKVGLSTRVLALDTRVMSSETRVLVFETRGLVCGKRVRSSCCGRSSSVTVVASFGMVVSSFSTLVNAHIQREFILFARALSSDTGLAKCL